MNTPDWYLARAIEYEAIGYPHVAEGFFEKALLAEQLGY